MNQDLENDQINHLWEHGTHEDTIFYNMLNFFLVFESVLLGVVGLLYSKTASPEPVLKIIGALGLSVTLVWEYAQIKQRRYIKIISARAQNLDANYELLVQKRGKGFWSLSVTGLLAYVIPTYSTGVDCPSVRHLISLCSGENSKRASPKVGQIFLL